MPYRRTNGTIPERLDFRRLADFAEALYWATDEEIQVARETVTEQMERYLDLHEKAAKPELKRRWLQLRGFWNWIGFLLEHAESLRSRNPSLEHGSRKVE